MLMSKNVNNDVTMNPPVVSRGYWLSKASNVKHKNKGAAVYVGSSPALCNPLFFCSNFVTEYNMRNSYWSIRSK